jgi:hypothetical protein
MPGKHSAKQKRQAKHIISGYKKKGMSKKAAASIAWATVNSKKKKKKK